MRAVAPEELHQANSIILEITTSNEAVSKLGPTWRTFENWLEGNLRSMENQSGQELIQNSRHLFWFRFRLDIENALYTKIRADLDAGEIPMINVPALPFSVID